MILLPLVETQAPSVAGIITACGTVLTSLGAILIGYWQFRINSQQKVTDKKVDENTAKVDTVHTIVNQQRTDAQRYQIALTELLRKHGIEVPIDQSLPVTGEPDAQPGQPS